LFVNSIFKREKIRILQKEEIMPRLIIILISLCFLIPIPLESKTVSKKEFTKEIPSYIKQNEHQIIRKFLELLSIPNVSADRKNVRKNAEWLKQTMDKRGIEAKVMETGGNPVVYGEVNVPGAMWTLGFYAHYDGQPVDPAEWTDSKPFEPVFRPGKLEAGTDIPKPIQLPQSSEAFNDDWRIYARSASDDKAAIIALLSAVDAIKSAGFPLKNNLKFIFEGEEEAGSTNLRPFLEKHKGLLKCDVLFMCDGPVYYSGNPTLFFGVRGVTTVEITVYGPDTNLHSGHYGNWAPNPGIRLAQLLSTMKDTSGRVLIEGFYDTVVPLTEREQEALKAVPPYDIPIMELYGFSKPEGGGMSLLESLQLPSLNINGIQSGWVGSQSRTIIPSTAVASFDIRMVKGNEAMDMIQKVIDHIEAQGYHVVEEDPDHQTRMKYPLIAKLIPLEKGYEASRTSMDLVVSSCIIRTLKDYSDKDLVIIPSLGGSLPLYVFNDILEVPTIGVPIANYDNNQHQPDENLRLGHLWQGIETFAVLMLTGKLE
jgi:acetylornithine deacetylase/succinyl-diaminopimelate desuccinylase-like protein